MTHLQEPGGESPAVTFLPRTLAQEVIVRGRRVPMLTAQFQDGGKILLVFDDRIALELDADNYEAVIDFVATVMENVMHPDCGRTFNPMVEIGAVKTEEQDSEGGGPLGF